MKIRAYNATTAKKGGPFKTFERALQWAARNLPGGIPPAKMESADVYRSELETDGRTMIMEAGGAEKCFAEDVVIFDADRYPPNEDGYIEW